MLDIFKVNQTPEPHFLDGLAAFFSLMTVALVVVSLVAIFYHALRDTKMRPGLFWEGVSCCIFLAGMALACNWFNDQFTTDKQHAIVALLLVPTALLFCIIFAVCISDAVDEKSTN